MAHKRRPSTPRHNLLLITEYHTKALEQNTIQTYAVCLNYTQTNDNKFIQSTLKITNLKLSTKEYNHDKDILTNIPTMQIQAPESKIYDQNGKYLATITTKRL